MSQSLRMSQFSMVIYLLEHLQTSFNHRLYRLWRKTGIPAVLAAFGHGWNRLEDIVPDLAFLRVLLGIGLFLGGLETLAAHGWTSLAIALAAIAGLYIVLPVPFYVYFRLRSLRHT